jgi:glucose/arabinose dehydrogenase
MPRSLRALLLLAAAGAVLAAGAGRASSGRAVPARPKQAAPPAPDLQLIPLTTELPDITSITNAGDQRLFVTRQSGAIVIWDGSQILPTPFLDVSTLIVCCGEQGLLSVAFSPSYALNGFFFINYTNLTGQTVIARYKVSDSDPNVADAFSGVILLTIDQPYTNHNGGQLQFGPDADLYIGMGDGGSANDPQCHAQASDSLLGKMLRIDVDHNPNPPYYAIPADNPYVFTTGPPEAWAYGLRNPWRFSFDRLTGDLYIGDVGQDSLEEIDYQPLALRGGQNYGWKVMEGSQCGAGGTSGCVVPPPPCGDPAYTPPVLEYSHSNGNCGIIGGYVYRGSAIAALKGMYVYGDLCTGNVWAASQQGGVWSTTPLPVNAPNLTTFGEGANGELYAGTQGVLYAVAPPPALPPTIDAIAPASGSTRGGQGVAITGTNFTGQTTVSFGALPSPSVDVRSDTLLVVTAPAHPVGLVDVTVTNPGVAPAVRQGGYGYVAIPPPPRPPHAPRVVER